MSLTTEEISEWRNHPLTKEVFKVILKEMDVQTAYGVTHIGDTTDKTLQEHCRIAGMLEGLSFIFEIEEGYDDEQSD